jgi:hypothetical protein
MKNKLVVLIVLMLFWSNLKTSAQLEPAIRFGATFGLVDDDINNKSVFVPFARYYGGVSISPTIKKKHRAQFQINSINRAFQRQLIFLNSDNEYTSYHYNTFVYSVELKAMYMLTIKNCLHFMGGVFYSNMFHQKTKTLYDNSPFSQSRFVPPTMNKSDYGVSIGATYDWFEKWQLDIGFTYGLQPLYKNPEPFENIQLRTITFGINRKIMVKK